MRAAEMLKTHRDKLAALLALLSLLSLTVWMWSNVTAEVMRLARERFEFKVSEARFAIDQRLLVYEHVLRGAVGLFAASDNVTREEWRTYVQNLSIDKHYPGIQGIGYSVRVPREEKAAHTRAIRAKGFPGYAIQPDGERAEFTSIVYLEPFDWRNQRAFGYDMFSEPVRRVAMTRARDAGMSSVSGRVTLVQETDKGVQQGFLMYLPVYPRGIVPASVAERRARLLGYVYSPFRMNDLMQGILGHEALPNIRLEIFDGDNASGEALMYDSTDGRAEGHSSAFSVTRPIELKGHRWLLRFSSLPEFDATIDPAKPRLILFGGAAISILFAVVVWALAMNRRRALALADANRGLKVEVAERKQAEDALRREYARADVLEENLRRSQKLEAVGTMAAGIAHDFNNILGAVLGYTELSLAEMPADSQGQKNLQQVLIASLRARDLVAQILAFAGHGEPQRVRLTLATLITDVAAMLRGSLPDNIRIDSDIRSASAAVFADPTQMTQVVMNLCVNASHAMRARGGTMNLLLDDVELGAASPLVAGGSLQAGRYVRLSVRDTGDGIATDVLDRIFDPFFTTKPVGEGSGLGLSVVHGIVSRYDGHIVVRTEVGKGTTFEIYLPPTDDLPAPEAIEAAAVVAPVRGGSGRVLFVDDEVQLTQVGQQMLRRLGYEPVVTTSPREALQRFQADPRGFVAVVTDQTMPDLTGWDLAQEVLRIRADTPIVLCTGFSHLVNAKGARAIGIRELLTKPVSVRDMDAALQRAFQPAKAA